MEKVYITKVLKGKEPIHAIGFLDIQHKKLYIPFQSKKGLSMIEEVILDFLSKQDETCYRGEDVLEIDGKHFMNVYYLNILK